MCVCVCVSVCVDVYTICNCVRRYLRWAQLLVDKAPPGAGPSTCDTLILELGMEGVAAPLDYELSPKLLSVAGSLTPGEMVTRTVTLTNRTRAPANFDFTGERLLIMHYTGTNTHHK